MPDAVIWIAVGAVLAAVVGIVVLGLARLRTLNRRVSAFACGERLLGTTGAAGELVHIGEPGPWVAGIAQYGAGRLIWWRIWSLSPRPARTWRRTELQVLDRRPMSDEGRPDIFRVRCRHQGAEFELAMSPDAYAGLMSWLESAPPRARDRVI